MAVIGSGLVAGEHVEALSRVSGVQVAWVVGSDRQRTETIAARAPRAVGTADLERVLSDPDVRGVVICTVTDTHAELVLKAISYGKRVLVEKPATLSLTDFDAITKAAAKAQVAVMVAQTARFQPVHRELHGLVRAGAIGRPRIMTCAWYLNHVWPRGWRAWQLNASRSGGHPVHNGIHLIDLATWIIGAKPTRVFGRSFRNVDSNSGVPDSFELTLRFDDGSMALVEMSYALHPRGSELRRVVVVGDSGTIRHQSGSEDNPASDTTLRTVGLEETIWLQDQHWIATLLGTEEPLVPFAQTRTSLAAALAGQRSLETGAVVELV